MRIRFSRTGSLLAGTIVVFLLTFSFNAHACLLPLSGTTETSMANGCSTPSEQPSRQLCDAFKTLGLESGSQSVSLISDHHLLADHGPALLPAMSHHFSWLFHRYRPHDSGPPLRQPLTSTVLRI
jgi:hypothetical protein